MHFFKKIFDPNTAVDFWGPGIWGGGHVPSPTLTLSSDGAGAPAPNSIKRIFKDFYRVVYYYEKRIV
jgi:hypothetical protein